MTAPVGFAPDVLGAAKQMFVDPQRCIGCHACEQACSECPDHGGQAMIHLDELDPGVTVQTAPTVCMHCEDPACASSCPADAIQVDPRGVVATALAERCIGCANCVVACPFGVPRLDARRELMTKCDLCHDRTSIGRAPMCATVCPSGALFYGTMEEVAARRASVPANVFRFGDQAVATRVHLMVPAGGASFHVTADAARPESRPRSRAEISLDEVLL